MKRLTPVRRPTPSGTPVPLAANSATPDDVSSAIERGGDDGVSVALDGVVTRFAALMKRMGRGYRLPDELIDEAIQEVRIRLWRTLASGADISRVPATYIYRTTMSAMLDLIRRRRTRRESAVDSLDARVIPLPASSPAPDAELDRGDVAREVERAIDGIAMARRPVVRMYLAGYAREEIAQLLGWSEAKTRNLLYRGLDDLRRALTERGITPEVRS
jgi:RNA polymerase sigma-70 factor (ECF subfamily)